MFWLQLQAVRALQLHCKACAGDLRWCYSSAISCRQATKVDVLTALRANLFCKWVKAQPAARQGWARPDSPYVRLSCQKQWLQFASAPCLCTACGMASASSCQLNDGKEMASYHTGCRPRVRLPGPTCYSGELTRGGHQGHTVNLRDVSACSSLRLVPGPLQAASGVCQRAWRGRDPAKLRQTRWQVRTWAGCERWQPAAEGCAARSPRLGAAGTSSCSAAFQQLCGQSLCTRRYTVQPPPTQQSAALGPAP